MDDPAAPAASGPKRIRSVPDRLAGTRPPGAVRSVPNQSRASARPPGTYAASFGTEKSWARGLGILWTLFTLTMLMEALNAAFYLLAGKIIWPPNSEIFLGSTHFVLPIDAGRLALGCTCFIGLWAGWGWMRYLLAAVDFLSGLWLVVGMIASHHMSLESGIHGVGNVPIYSRIESFPKMALGILYLITAAYVVFSIDVQEFIAHRRARGRLWSALLVTVASYGCPVLILGAQPVYNSWLHTQRLGAVAFGEDTLRAMSNRWTPDCIDDRLEPTFSKWFTPEGRKANLTDLKDLGPLRHARSGPLIVITTVQSQPLQNLVPAPADIATGLTEDGTGFQMRSRYSTTDAEFEHGEARFTLELVRSLFGRWQVCEMGSQIIRLNRSHGAAPADASTPPDASPAPTTSTPNTNAASSPTAATLTPAATPVPSTGG